MTLQDFIEVQQQLMSAYGWFIRWWLIAFLVSGVFASLIVWIISLTKHLQNRE
jgi:hypothetical protein